MWICVRRFLHDLLTETVTGMFQSHNEKAVRLLANTMRLKPREEWRSFMAAADGVGFIVA